MLAPEGSSAFQFFGPLGGATVRAQQAPALAASEGLPTPQSFFPGRSPILANPPEWTPNLPATHIHRPAARPFLPALRTPIDPPLRVFPQTTLEGHRFARATALPQLGHRVPVEPVVIASRWRAGFHPRSSPTAAASHRSPCAAALPHGASELAQRLECARLLALLESNTAPGVLPATHYFDFHACRISCSSNHAVPDGRLPPRRGVGAPAQAASA